MIKRILVVALLGVAGSLVGAGTSEAGVFYRGPVRRVAARAVLPPYRVARPIVAAPLVVAPVVGPVVRPAYVPMYYGAPYVYGGGVSVVVGY